MGEMLLEWKDHDKDLSTKLWEFFTEEYLVDFSVTCHEKQIKVHKFVLALMFPILKDSLRSTATTFYLNQGQGKGLSAIPQAQILNLDNITEHAEDIDYLIQFVYTGKTNVPKEHADCLMRIAEMLEVKSLKDSLNQWQNKIEPDVIERKPNIIGKRPNVIEEMPRVIEKMHRVIEKTPNVSKTMRKVVETVPHVVETVPHVVETVPHVVETLPNIIEKMPNVVVVKCEDVSDFYPVMQRESIESFDNFESNECFDDCLSQLVATDYEIEINSGTSLNKDTTLSANEEVNEIESFKCPHCIYIAKYKSRLEQHMKIHTKKQRKQFICKLCNTDVGSNNMINIHRDSKCGTEPHVCKYCGLKTLHRYALFKHVMSRHQVDADGNPLERNVKCLQCDFVCYAKHQLRAHVLSRHERWNKLKCKECDFTAPYSNQLMQHEQFVHRKRKDYPCEECGFKFQTKTTLKNHTLVVHQRLKPYKCETCNVDYSSKWSYKTHMLTHEDKGGYLQECNICGHRLRKKMALIKHLRKKHGIDLEVTTDASEPMSL